MGSEWKETTIGDLCKKVVTGGTPLTSNEAFYKNAFIPWLKTKEVNFCRIYETENHISEIALRESSVKLIPENSVIVAMYGQGDTAGRVAINKIPLTTNQACCNLIIDEEKADYRYVYFYLKNSYQELVRRKTGSAQPNLNTSIVKAFEIRVPPLSEQKSVADFLTAIDDKIALNRQINTTLESMAQALFKSWFVDFDPVIDNALAAGHEIPDELQARAARRRTLLSANTETAAARLPQDIQQLFPNRFVFTEEMGWVPEGWEAIKFSDLVEAKQGKYLAKDEMKELPEGDFIYPVWGGNGILGYSLKKAYEEPVTLMTCRGSNCGLIKTTQSPAWVSNNSFACSSKYGSQYFLYLYFLSEDFSECVSGSAQPQITYTALKNKLMKYPVSKNVCDAFSQRVAVFREKQFDNDRQMELLSHLRDSLLPKLLSGQLSIPDAEQALDVVN